MSCVATMYHETIWIFQIWAILQSRVIAIYRANYIAFIIVPFIFGKCSATMTYRFDDVSEIREKYNLHTAATHQHSYTINYIAEI